MSDIVEQDILKKRKDDHEELPVLTAQRFLNIFRQIHIFPDKKQKELYDQVVSNTRRIADLNEELLSKKDKATQNVLEKEKNRLIEKNKDLITRVYQQNF